VDEILDDCGIIEKIDDFIKRKLWYHLIPLIPP
jgi:hypothetical protein